MLPAAETIGRELVGLVLVQLARGDHVAGEKALREWGNYCAPEEVWRRMGELLHPLGGLGRVGELLRP